MKKDFKTLDAMRGVMWEGKFRGRLEDYPSPDLLQVGASRLLKIPERPPEVVTNDWPVNRVGWGTYRWKYDPDLVTEALNAGAGIIDTAEGYGFGKVEKELGKVLVTGVGPTWIATKVSRNHLSTTAVVSAGERSRDRLRVPTINLYQVHWPVPSLFAKTADGLAELIDRGTIERVGVCNFSAGHLSEFSRLGAERGFRIVSNQVRLSRSDPAALDYLIPFSVRMGVRIIVHSPLDQGKVGSPASKSIKWVLSQPGVSSVIPGTNNVIHLRENLGLN